MDLYRTAFLKFLGGHLGELILVTGKAGICILYSCPLFLSSIPVFYSCLPTSVTVLGGSVFN
jgi:hypothetical protein